MSNNLNYKTFKQNKLEDYIIKLFSETKPNIAENENKSENELLYNVVQHYVSKFKFKPHKKLSDKITFIECALRYGHLELLNKFVPNLLIHSPQYNIINACVNANNPKILSEYVKKKE